MTVLLISGFVLFAVWAVAISLTVGCIVERNADLRGSIDVLHYEGREGKPRSKRSVKKGRRADLKTPVRTREDRLFRRSSSDDALNQQSGNLTELMYSLRWNMAYLSAIPGSKLLVNRP